MSGPIVRGRVLIPVDEVLVEGDIAIPIGACAIVLLVHGGDRMSPPPRELAQALQSAGVATLLLDLLAGDAAAGSFAVEALAERLAVVTDWVAAQPALATFALGCFGAGPAAAVALLAAAKRPTTVRAVVSQAGRTSLADAALARIEAPTLLIVGRKDPEGIDENIASLAKLRCDRGFIWVAGASRLFTEEGSFAQVVLQATEWFSKSLLTPDESVTTWSPGGPPHLDSPRLAPRSRPN